MRYYERYRGIVACACGRKWEAELTKEKGVPAGDFPVYFCPGCIKERTPEWFYSGTGILDYNEAPVERSIIEKNIYKCGKRFLLQREETARVGEMRTYEVGSVKRRPSADLNLITGDDDFEGLE